MAESSSIRRSEPLIRVGIMAAASVDFELKGSFRSGNKLVASGEYTVSSQELIAGKIVYEPQNSQSTFCLKKVTIGIGFHWEQAENQEFEGALILQYENGLVRAVNAVPLENYLKSVISSEMSAMNDLNLLNAHAVVSRSWLLAQLQNRQAVDVPSFTQTDSEIKKWYDREDHVSFDVCADDHCQRYQGITKVISENALQAVENTRGVVLVYEDKICDARFSKCCGGMSEDFENVWQPVHVPYLVAVKDIDSSSGEVFCNTSDPEILRQVLIDFDQSTVNFYRWRVKYTQNQLSEIIARKSGIDFGEIIDLQPIERGKSGRINRLKIIGTKRELIVGKELEIRKWLSDSHLYSSAFEVEKVIDDTTTVPHQFILHGSGWGHGVGMCQIGAAVMSRKGYSFEAILNHYFTGAKLEKIY
ncbi:MAG: SpoIID/LytB domain-containing protein [Bacteroidales bacterium]|nr:SpoIID/LytB domain-containing protein [Bacteroidales bacterium]